MKVGSLRVAPNTTRTSNKEVESREVRIGPLGQKEVGCGGVFPVISPFTPNQKNVENSRRSCASESTVYAKTSSHQTSNSWTALLDARDLITGMGAAPSGAWLSGGKEVGMFKTETDY